LSYGHVSFKAGTIQYFLRRKDIPQNDKKYKEFACLEGTLLLISSEDHTLITVYRNKNANKNEHKKSKYNLLKKYDRLPLVN